MSSKLIIQYNNKYITFNYFKDFIHSDKIIKPIKYNKEKLLFKRNYHKYELFESNDEIDYDKIDTICIINEYVKDSELTPIPKEFLNVICSKVKYRRDNIIIISMKELYELLREYEAKFDEAKKITKLPDIPDMQSINYLQYKINKDVVKNSKW